MGGDYDWALAFKHFELGDMVMLPDYHISKSIPYMSVPVENDTFSVCKLKDYIDTR